MDERSRRGGESSGMAVDGGSPEPQGSGHAMLREIYQQPEMMAATLERYVDADGFRRSTCGQVVEWVGRLRGNLLIAASGSSRHAGLAAELMIEELSGIPVDVEYASEYCYRSEKALSNTGVIVVSQSGETADTLATLRKAKLAWHETLAITNVDGSSMDLEAMVAFPTLAGQERAVPATKSFTAQLLNLYLLTLMSAVSRGVLSPLELQVRLRDLAELPRLVRSQIGGWDEAMRGIAVQYGAARSFLFLGRGIHYPIAREGALKLKESAYLHAEGYPSGELKHGPNALVGVDTPLVMIATVDRASEESLQRYEKVVQLMRDMREQGADMLAIANAGDDEVAWLANHTVHVEEAGEAPMAMCEVIPLQLFAYWMAVNKGIDVDQPRNLTKAVLAE